ncbi:MAG: putative glycoside hydrolase [Candidatus Paceibacterota bacterium]
MPALLPITSTTSVSSISVPFVVTHVETPESLKAVYYTSWAAGNSKFRKELFDLIEKTEVNAVVIDVKDYTGRISFPVEDPILKKTGAAERRIPDIKEFIGRLHAKGIYVIARISSFQDSYLINVHPEWAVKTTGGNIWKDYKGVKWLDAGAEPVWNYLVAIGHEAYNVGFDELNFDYIRFPSDGDLKDIAYSWGEGRTRSEVMEDFYKHLHDEFARKSIPISADLFGLTTSAVDDLGIGQVMEKALPYFDYVYPMVYPSHYSHGFNGFARPAEHPYEVIKYSMEHAIQKAAMASTSPMKIRPWLQAFNLGATYTPAMVRAQIEATYDSGLSSWLLWNAGSVYDQAALLPKEEDTAVIVTGVPR